MSGDDKPAVGRVVWMDLTVEGADRVRDFYRAVVGWDSQEVDMGEYSDFGMTSPDGEMVAGVCWSRGANAGLPSQWLVYITVADLDASLESCRSGGGEVLAGPRQMGEQGRYAVIRDPAGAVAALWQSV